jgi:GT2 family glycosyltransferase
LDLSIILINYRMKGMLTKCISSILKTQNFKNYEIILVNKPCGDDTEYFIKHEFPSVRIISHDKFGVAEMRNVGIRNSNGRYLLMLDTDTEVKSDFTNIIKFMKNHQDAGALGPKLVAPDLSLQYSCRTFYDIKTTFFRRTFLGDLFPKHRVLRKHLMLDWDHNDIKQVDWVQGACFFMSRKAITNVGLFDEFSPFGCEDVAWCSKARQKGWNVYYFPEVKVIHNYQRSSRSLFSKRATEHLISFIKYYIKYGFKNLNK